MDENFAVVVAPLWSKEYSEAMERLTNLQKLGFFVAQRNVMILHNRDSHLDEPYVVYWMERTMEVQT